MFEITIPPGAIPGSMLRIQAGGLLLDVAVPPGAVVGQRLQIQVPVQEDAAAAAAPPAAAPAPAPAPAPAVAAPAVAAPAVAAVPAPTAAATPAGTPPAWAATAGECVRRRPAFKLGDVTHAALGTEALRDRALIICLTGPLFSAPSRPFGAARAAP